MLKKDLEKHRRLLRKAFFGDHGVFKDRTSVEHDFWQFCDKYIALSERRKADSVHKDLSTASTSSTPDTEVSGKFDRNQKLISKVNLSKPDRYLIRDIPAKIVNDFEQIICAYLQFLQREKFAKLKKLRMAQMSLPIFSRKSEILKTIGEHQVTIIAGDTGCGKSTQVPQYLLGGGFENIACTQPRRIACTALSNRVAFETLHEYGTKVAYQIRFEKTKTLATKLLFLTEGLLLRQLATDDMLSMYNVIILDEVHERNLNGDFLLGILKDLVTRRGDVKLVLMSATINLDLFKSYFQDAPVIEVPGRLHSIDLQYRPTSTVDKEKDDTDGKKNRKGGKGNYDDKFDPSPFLKVLQLVDHKYPEHERGDMLVFLSGITEITTTAEAMKPYAENTKRWIILQLHSTLSIEEQDKVFDLAPPGVRKCILTTNIAETSITIEGVRFVVDSGKAKQMTYDPSSKMHSLKETWISKASANQRKGRAGRTGPGVCFRLYSEKEFDKLDPFSVPEIRRVSLDSLVLQMYNLGMGDPRHFPFIEPPSADKLEEAIEYLKDIGALTSSGCEELSSLGKMMVRLPVDTSIAKMLIFGCLFKQVEPVLVMAAALSVQSPFTAQSFRDLDCIALRQNDIMSSDGDPFALLNAYREWLEVKSDGREPSRKWCRNRGIEEQRLYEISKLKDQFKQLLEDGDMIDKFEDHMTSSERRIRHGELKRLKDLRREYQNVKKKRKVLRTDAFDAVMPDAADNETDEASGDVRAVDFRLRYTANSLRGDLEELDIDGFAKSLIKIILCTALYPQFGVLDEHNHYRQGADIMLHTKLKPFSVLHPNSCLAQDPQVLCFDSDKDGYSPVHQAVFYALLLDTTKPFIVNSFRVSAIHALLLTARRLDTSVDFTRVMVDEFVEVDVRDSGMLVVLLLAVMEIRSLMVTSLERKLEGDRYHSSRLARKIGELLDIQLDFRIKRLMTADLNCAFADSGVRPSVLLLPEAVKKGLSPAGLNQIEQREDTPGWQLTGYLTWGSLVTLGSCDGEAEFYLQSHWTCPHCDQELIVNARDRIDHLTECRTGKEQEESQAIKGEPLEESRTLPVEPKNPLSKQYFCDKCEESFEFTSLEILKHRRSHVNEKKDT